MFLEIRPVKDLGFTCVGRHMHDEFFQAATILQSHVAFGKWRLEDRVQIFLDIASSGRRCKPGDNAQRQKLLEYGRTLVDNSMDDIAKIEEANERDRLYGYALYEKAYIELRRGQLSVAERSFSESVEHEYKRPDRQVFGIMSASIQAIVLTYLGREDDAKKILDQHKISIIQMLRDDSKREKLFRFAANYWHVAYEVALARRNPYEAQNNLDTYLEWQTKSGSVVNREMYDARLALLEGDFSKALDLARVAIASREAMTHADTYMLAHRVYADALLGTGDTGSAIATYRSLLPDAGSEFFDPEAQLIRDDRLARLDQGQAPIDILSNTRV